MDIPQTCLENCTIKQAEDEFQKMEPQTAIPVCAPAPSDMVPMLVVAGVFLLGWGLLRRWRKAQGSRKRRK